MTQFSFPFFIGSVYVGHLIGSVSFQPADILTVRDYALSLTAKLTVKERGTGKVLFNREVIGRTTVRAGTDLASAERQAVPLLATDLARNATSLIVDGTW